MTRQPLRSSFDRLANRVLSSLAVRRSSGHDQPHELSLFLKHADLANGGLLRISVLDIFGLNLLAALGLNQRRNAAEDMQLTVVIKVTHIASAKPFIIAESLFRFLLKIPVARKNICSARQNFADLVSVDVLFFFERFRIDPNLHAGKWFSHAVFSRFSRQAQREQRRTLGQAVTDGDLPAERFAFVSQFRIKCRAAGSEEPKLFTETFMQRAKQPFADAPAKPFLHELARGEENVECSARDPAGRFHSRFDIGIKRAVEPWHTDDRRHFAFA